jgi:hypothetical protein
MSFNDTRSSYWLGLRITKCVWNGRLVFQWLAEDHQGIHRCTKRPFLRVPPAIDSGRTLNAMFDVEADQLCKAKCYEHSPD